MIRRFSAKHFERECVVRDLGDGVWFLGEVVLSEQSPTRTTNPTNIAAMGRQPENRETGGRLDKGCPHEGQAAA